MEGVGLLACLVHYRSVSASDLLYSIFLQFVGEARPVLFWATLIPIVPARASHGNGPQRHFLAMVPRG